MSDTPNIMPITSLSKTAAPQGAATKLRPGHSPHYYRIGIIGSKSSGKTCLLAALSMPRNPSPLGYTAARIPAEDEKNIELCNGDKWIKEAIVALEAGNWPAPNPHERVTVRFWFSDGRTREKYVELVDYSGELLNPDAAQADLAKRLRELLREMDGLIVLAEYPLPGDDSSKVGTALNGLLGVIALLNAGEHKKSKRVERLVPISMVVNKWDRSAHFETSPESDGEAQMMLERFLTSEPQPFHASVGKALRPAAGGRFKSFPVSAIGAVRRECTGGQAREVPPAKGMLMSVGVEDPFIWLIQERDEIDIAEHEQSLKRRSNWLRLPWPPGLRHREFRKLRSRFAPGTQEAVRMARVRRRSWLLAFRQLLVYAVIFVAMEGVNDVSAHRNAEEAIKNPTQQDGWQRGTEWLRAYGRSNPLRHTLYSKGFLTKQAALDRAIKVTEAKDEEMFSSIPTLSPGVGIPVEESRLVDAERKARQQMLLFPNSPRNEERLEVIAKVQHIRDDLEFEKQLGGWSQRLDWLRPADNESEHDVQIKLGQLKEFVAEVRDTKAVPLDGPLREKWKALLDETDPVRIGLAEKRSTLDLAARIRQAKEADDFLQAADLLATPEFKKNPNPNLLNEFQLSLDKGVREKSGTLSRQGENWEAAVQYAEKFLEPARRSVLSDFLINSIQNTISNAKKQGDKYFYNLARNNKNTPSLDAYLQNSPLKSMAQEVINYRKWLEDREVPRTLTFRLVKIEWDPSLAKGYMGKTAIKLYVNDSNDSRNDAHEENSRSGTTADKAGVRVATVDDFAQTQPVRIVFQSWHIPSLYGNWERKSRGQREISPEDLCNRPGDVDDAGSRFEIQVEGVLKAPFMPAWSPPQ